MNFRYLLAWIPDFRASSISRFFVVYVLVILGCLTFSQMIKAQTCDTIVSSNDPSTCLPSSWSNVLSSGSYCTNSQTDNIYWQISVETTMGVHCTDSSLNSGPYTKRYCTGIQADDPETPENEYTVRVVYGDTFQQTCPSGYQISSGHCELMGSCPVQDVEPEVCDDGFPPEAAEDIGYPTTCDRPILKICSDGSYVREDTGFCPTVCFDYSSCYEYAVNESGGCPTGSTEEFIYISPDQPFQLNCNNIPTDSPDSPSNGGDGDGNPFNDPNTPTTGDGSTPNSGDIDPQSLANYIDDALQDNFDTLERAQRDALNQSKVNTNTLEGAINDVEATNYQGFTDVENAIRNGNSSMESGLSGIETGVNTLSNQLGELNDNLGNSGPCDPTQPDYYQCLNNPMSNLPGHSTGSATTVSEVNANFKARIDSAPVVLAFSGMANLLNLQSAECPEFSIDFPAPINETVSTHIHCDLMQTISPVLSAVMTVIYIWLGFRIFASA